MSNQERDLGSEALEQSAEDALNAGFEEDSSPGERSEGFLMRPEEEMREEAVAEEIPEEEIKLNKMFDDFERSQAPEEEKAPEIDQDEKFEKRVRNMEGKFGEMNGTMQALLKKLDSPSQPPQALRGASAPSKAEMLDAYEDGTKFVAFKEEFPEWAEAMEEKLGLQASNLLGKIPDVDGLRAEFKGELNAANETAANARSLAYLDIKHEGWEEAVKSQAFQSWMSSQPAEVQELKHSPRVKDALVLLDGFGAERKRRYEREERRGERGELSRSLLERSDTPTSGGSTARRSTGGMSADEAFEQGFEG